MAKYKREFLVPYLEDLFALHMAEQKLESNLQKAIYRKESAERDLASLDAPDPPMLENTGFLTFGLVAGVVLVFVSWLDILIVSFLTGLFGWLLTVPYAILLFLAIRNNRKKEDHYQEAYEQYSKLWDKKREALDENIMVIYAQKEIYDQEIEQLRSVRDRVYSANIIPGRFRDLYAIAFLYDWFSTGGSDDLDMALNNFVLTQIKDRLDDLIRQLTQVLLNQRVMIANQHRTMELQEKRHREMVEKLDRLQLTEEEHTQYLQMIEGNTAATAYFCGADYIRKILS